jgi:AAA+ superfamily predicted ATPase
MQTNNNCMRLISLLRAKTKLIYVINNDESHTTNCIRQSVMSWMLKQAGKKKVDLDTNLKYFEWSVIKGLESSSVTNFSKDDFKNNVWNNILTNEEVLRDLQMKRNQPDDPTSEILTALTRFENEKPPTTTQEYTHVLVIKDMHNFHGPNNPNPVLIRKIRDIIMNPEPKNVFRHIIIAGPVKKIPIDLENQADIIEWKLPDAQDIDKFVRSLATINIVKEKKGEKGEYTEQEYKDVINAFIGLPYCRIEEHCCQCYVEHERRLEHRFLSKLKTKHIMENSSLELVDTNVDMQNVGGMDTFKAWVKDRTVAFSKQAEDFGVESPKGVMLVGIQGCGKTLMSRAISSMWGLPLVKFDVAKVFSKTIGSSEENIRNTLATIEALSPCVVQIDEIEKGLSGVGSSNMSDGGTTSRVVGTLLSWMQDKTAQAFIIATANDVSQLPPELLRKGRFDEIFFCALPESKEREDIFAIHLKKRKYDPSGFNLKAFADKTVHYSGAEIEQIIKTANLMAFNSTEKKLENKHVLTAIRETIPLYDTCKQDIEWLLAWVGWDEERKEGLRARFASGSAKDNHADPNHVAETENGKKVVMKMKASDKKS